ncbi:MAG: hypothetical protein M3R44_02205 [Candidatus Eremiobacteraeota bacterium]|nr:hypothetical protein [Candidatus Eremiobacteraeota bacterium]
MTATISQARSPWRLLPALLLLAALLAGIAPRPAAADGAASTRNIILGAAAIAAGIIIYNNVHHKNVQHNTVVGYTRDGGTVYADGRIVYPNGNVLYTGNRNGQPCGYAAGYASCGGTPVAYYPRNGEYGRRDADDAYRNPGRHRGWGHHKHHHGDRDDRAERHGDGDDGNR